jgi:transposase
VSETADRLPTDIDALQALVTAARAERDAAIAKCYAAVAERDDALSQMDRLRHLLRQLQRAQFGRRSEKLDPEQWQLAIEDIEQAVAGEEAAEDKKDPAGAHRRADKRRAVAARLRPICRTSMSRLPRKIPTARAAARRCM